MTIIKKLESDNNDRQIVFQSRKITLAAAAFLSILIVAEIWVSHTMVSFGENFKDIENLQRTYVSENLLLESEIAKQASLSNIASQSAELGFTKQKNIQYIR